jgi:hypothetical protein
VAAGSTWATAAGELAYLPLGASVSRYVSPMKALRDADLPSARAVATTDAGGAFSSAGQS